MREPVLSKRAHGFWLAWLVLAVSCCLLSGCEEDGSVDGKSYLQRRVEDHVFEVDRDGCQYIIFYDHDNSCMVHKGNCPNPVHRHE